MYSTAFRRLGRVTQVVSSTERQLLHNRLTHSLEVAQIGRGLAVTLLSGKNARSIAAQAGGLSPDVVEAAGLAHDLGHPPFGHVAEKELNSLIRSKGLDDGFEGNAQSFRIVTRLATRHKFCEGLNLTRATLCAILKYPWPHGGEGKKAKKWGAYDSEVDQLKWARKLIAHAGEIRSLEAALMDWADDIAYAVHDLDDFFRSGLIPLDRLATDKLEQQRFLESESTHIASDVGATAQEIERAFLQITSWIPLLSPYQGAKGEKALLKIFTSALINRYINSMSLVPGGIGEDALKHNQDHRVEVAILKRLTWHYVIDSQPLSTQRFGQRSLIRSLFNAYCESALSGEEPTIFPTFYRELLEAADSGSERIRIVADVVSSMNEAQAIEMNQRLTGQSLGFALDRPLA